MLELTQLEKMEKRLLEKMEKVYKCKIKSWCINDQDQKVILVCDDDKVVEIKIEDFFEDIGL